MRRRLLMENSERKYLKIPKFQLGLEKLKNFKFSFMKLDHFHSSECHPWLMDPELNIRAIKLFFREWKKKKNRSVILITSIP